MTFAGGSVTDNDRKGAIPFKLSSVLLAKSNMVEMKAESDNEREGAIPSKLSLHGGDPFKLGKCKLSIFSFSLFVKVLLSKSLINAIYVSG